VTRVTTEPPTVSQSLVCPLCRRRDAAAHKLTYRGLEKVKDLMEVFDTDKDGKLDFSDFRAYLQRLNRCAGLGHVTYHHHCWPSPQHNHSTCQPCATPSYKHVPRTVQGGGPGVCGGQP
jgi:hypothetical protein